MSEQLNDSPMEFRICSLCSFESQNKGEMSHHFRICHIKSVMCSECDFKDRFAATVKEHFTNSHQNNQLSFRCSICKKSFEDNVSLAKHWDSLHAERYLPVLGPLEGQIAQPKMESSPINLTLAHKATRSECFYLINRLRHKTLSSKAGLYRHY